MLIIRFYSSFGIIKPTVFFSLVECPILGQKSDFAKKVAWPLCPQVDETGKIIEDVAGDRPPKVLTKGVAAKKFLGFWDI